MPRPVLALLRCGSGSGEHGDSGDGPPVSGSAAGAVDVVLVVVINGVYGGLKGVSPGLLLAGALSGAALPVVIGRGVQCTPIEGL